MRFLWFITKYTFLLFILVTSIVYSNVGWWNEDPRRSFILLLSAAVSYGPILITYLENGDWLRVIRR